jgi:prepilin-type N-terminal cleavage/methylation domain-containing protein
MSSPLTRGERGAVRSRRAAFTLIELLTVIAIIGILAAITFGIAKGVQERAAINQTRVELAALAQALENYKKHYGDYPRVTTTTAADGALQLYQSLNGQRGPTGAVLNPRQKAFLEASLFALETPDAAITADNRILDPWGRAYRYLYNPAAAAWQKRPYLLFSLGPTTAGNDDVSTMTDGVPITTGNHADNIYANN